MKAKLAPGSLYAALIIALSGWILRPGLHQRGPILRWAPSRSHWPDGELRDF